MLIRMLNKYEPTRLEKKLQLPIVLKPVTEIDDYLELFDTDFPPEFNEIANASKEDREGMEKERDIREMIKRNVSVTSY